MVGESRDVTCAKDSGHVAYTRLRGQDFRSAKPDLAASEYISQRELAAKAATVGFVSTCSTLHTYCSVLDLRSSQASNTAKNKI